MTLTVRQILLRPIARTAAIRAWRNTRAFLKAHRRTAQTQHELLQRLITEHADTAFGRDHGFAKIRTYREFVQAVPIRPYEQVSDYFDRVFNGDFNALLPPGVTPIMFSMTSGTTGSPKYIPVTQAFLEQMRSGFNILGLNMLNRHKAAWLHPIMVISSPMDERLSPTALPCGAISGFIAAHQQKIVRRMYPAPYPVTTIGDPTAKYYTLMRCGMPHDVAFFSTANPSSIVKLIETGQRHIETLIRDIADGTYTPPTPVPDEIARLMHFRPDRKLAAQIEAGLAADGQFLPRHIWEIAFLACWTGGTCQLYVRRLRELFGRDVPFRDIGLLASEGRFSIPLEDNTPAGVAEITGNVLEFIPADQHGHPAPDALQAHEVEVGKEYFLVVTNSAGLWRYSIDDRVRVVARHDQSPVLEFLSRGPNTCSLTGEKLTEHQVVEAMRHAIAGADLGVERFQLQPVFATTPCYSLRIEQGANGQLSQLAEQLDAALGQLNVEYHSKRQSGRLGPIRLDTCPAGTYETEEREKIQSRHGRSEQYKHQYLLTDIIDETTT